MIVSDTTDVVTTGITLQSVHKFLMYGHIHQDSPHVAEAVSSIAYHATHCHWDGGRKEESQVVHMKILEVLLECLRCDAGDLLTNETICTMISECFNVRGRPATSKILLKYAENILMHMVLVVFARLTPETNTGGDVIDPTQKQLEVASASKSDAKQSSVPLRRSRSGTIKKSFPRDSQVRRVCSL